ncbi:TetR/AcrR family transcriptional regulator [Zavarzinia sp. CC-PAN008]|uniref:TetR/AcrR family transcriptional regulator n=1 Tax=Zavarzinia sp. CC-PAN008 TaxID=3243332 RepID=UPI003F746DEC
MRGRPRDPGLEDRVLDAAIALYAEGGWAAFTYEALARRSGVGKAALYGRWPQRATLLRRTFEARWLAPDRIDTGTLRGDLVALARQVSAVLTGPHAGVMHWRLIDALLFPEVRDATAPYAEAAVAQGRAIVRRAIARGEVVEHVNPGLLMDLVVGGVTNHVGTTPLRLREAMLDKMEAFTSDLVDTVLRGVAQGAPTEQR